jgi:hypothetical protein
MPYNIEALGNCQVAGPASRMTCPLAGDGSTAPEQFISARPDGGTDPILPGQPMQLQSVQTGLWCRVVALGEIACDQPTAATAATLTYTGTGMSYNGAPFVNPGGGKPAYFGAPGTSATSATFLPPPIPTDTPVSILITSKGYLVALNSTVYTVSAGRAARSLGGARLPLTCGKWLTCPPPPCLRSTVATVRGRRHPSCSWST